MEGSAVKIFKQVSDGFIKVSQIKKGDIAEPCQNPLFYCFYSGFNLGFVFRASYSGRDDCAPVM